MKRFTTILLIAALVAIGAAFTCSNQAAKVSLGVAASAKAFQDGEIALHNQGKIGDGEHVLIQQSLIQLATAGKAVNQCIGATGAASCVDPAIKAIDSIQQSAISPIKNKESQQQLTILLGSVRASFIALQGAL